MGHTKHFSRPEFWRLRGDDNNVLWCFLQHLSIHWFSWLLPFFSFSTQNSCLLSLFTFFALPLVTLIYWNFFVIKKCVSHYPLSLSHLSLLHLVIWIHFYFMYWFFPSFRLLNSSWILVLCLLKDFFLPVFLLLFWSKWKNLPPLHHILGP